MFMHRNGGRHAQAVSLGILIAAIIRSAGHAAETRDPFAFVAYSDCAGGENPASGEYATAAQALQLHQDPGMPDPQTLESDRCGAYAMTGQLAPARRACGAAVRDAQSAGTGALSWSPHTQQQSSASAAVAYANRAALHRLAADLRAAAADLARAQALAPQASFVARNVAAMRARQTLVTRTTATARAGVQE